MKTRLTVLSAVGLLLIGVVAVTAEQPNADVTATNPVATIDEPAPDFTLMDATGKKHSLSDYDGKFVVLEWINFGCPFVKKHYNSGNMQNLQATYTKKGVIWLTICSSAPGKQGYLADAELVSAIKEHELKGTAYLVDPSGAVGRMYQAKTTPNMYVINPDGVLIYAGAIDDKPTVKIEDVESATNYLSAALDEAMNGKKVSIKLTQPYGCSVKYAKK